MSQLWNYHGILQQRSVPSCFSGLVLYFPVSPSYFLVPKTIVNYQWIALLQNVALPKLESDTNLLGLQKQTTFQLCDFPISKHDGSGTNWFLTWQNINSPYIFFPPLWIFECWRFGIMKMVIRGSAVRSIESLNCYQSVFCCWFDLCLLHERAILHMP
jgi:hypothetical protein